MHQPTTATDRAPGTIANLRAELRGALIEPADPGYEDRRRVFNSLIDRRPVAIVKPATTDDVSLAVRFAREHGIELAVRGGAHSFAGHGASEGGLVVDMAGMQSLEIDPAERMAWAGAGLTAGEYTDRAGEHGLATGFGDTGDVGIAGITLGGGIGFLVRKHGLTIDDLLAAEVVTADGELLQVDADTHPDLFWALRGGGGNFGVVTRLRYRLHEVGTILGGALVLPASPEIVRQTVAFADDAPEELSLIAHLAQAPPLPFLGAEHHGRLALIVMLAWAGDLEAGERALAPLRALATPLADAVKAMPYPELYAGESPPGAPLAVRSAMIDDVDEAMVGAAMERLHDAGGRRAAFQIRVLGGAMARVPADATAFAHRARRMMAVLATMGESPAEGPDLEGWVDDSAAALGLDGAGAYVNYIGAHMPHGARSAYPAATYTRLAEIKRRYDPENLFRMNQNVAPAGSDGR